MQDSPEALFFSRGRGHSHALRDMAVADELLKLQSHVEVKFVSYGTGAATFAQHGRPVTDLGMPDLNPLWETVVRAGSVIAASRPDVVVSHEEFSVVPLARSLDIPSVFITDWFDDPEDPAMQALRYADEIVFVDEPGLFEEPPYLEGKVYYAGAILRPFQYTRSDRERAQRELGFPSDATVILVAPGGYGTEERAPIADIMLAAFDSLGVPGKVLVWLVLSTWFGPF